MLLYVEGLDESGKSTFIRKPSESLDIVSIRKSTTNSPNRAPHFFKGMGYSLTKIHNILKFDAIVTGPLSATGFIREN